MCIPSGLFENGRIGDFISLFPFIFPQASLYETNFRPVPLEEYIKVGRTIYNKQMGIVRTVSKSADMGGKDPDHIVELCDEVGHPNPPPPIFFPSPSFDEKLIGEINFHTLNNIRLFKRVTQFSYFVLVAKDASQLQGMLQNFSRNSLAALLTIRKSYWILIVPSTDCENLLQV